MNNPDLKKLLKTYEQKRLSKEKECDERITKLYNDNPNLSDIVDKINEKSIELSKCILFKKDSQISILEKEINNLKIQKQELLKKLNIKPDFFTPSYECKKCNDTGFLVDSNGVMCTCLKQKLMDIQYNKSNISNLENENFDKFNELVFSDITDEKKYNSNISPRENINNIKNIALNFIDNFDNPNEKNLLFTGNTGLGKTFISNCIANEILKIGKTVLYQTASNMLDSIIDYKFGKTNGELIYENILNADLLIIDELGTENLNSVKFAELFNVINTRLLNQNNHITKTIISTNLTLNNLFNNYDERIFSRLAGYYNICKFFGDDIRLKR